jgi:glycerol-3-phosphate dehydrogenase
MMDHVYDLVIIGGGINGCGCAADAAMRGLSVLLCEQGDIASKTSSSSSKLIHGGLRYLEHYDFALVKKALDEQQVLLQIAPHLVRPMPFVLPHTPEGRSHWLVRAGLFLYDHLSFKNTLPNSQAVVRDTSPQLFAPLINKINDGYVYYDCSTDDARLTLANALQAKIHGATILTQTACIQAKASNQHWHLTLKKSDDTLMNIEARAVVNAGGPWVNHVNTLLNIPITHPISYIKGSHIVIDQQYEGEQAYVLEQEDKRIVFVMPYHGKTLIGTTEIAYPEMTENVQITADEIAYLCALNNHYFNQQIKPDDIRYTFSGVRPLLSDETKTASALSRDYLYEFSTHPAPIVSIYGGKITTYRKLAEQVIDTFGTIFKQLKPTTTHQTPLPGAVFDGMTYDVYCSYALEKYHWLNQETLNRYLTTYGTLTEHILKTARKEHDLGQCFMPTLYQAEIDYLKEYEWAKSMDDILWRRTKLGLLGFEFIASLPLS